MAKRCHSGSVMLWNAACTEPERWLQRNLCPRKTCSGVQLPRQRRRSKRVEARKALNWWRQRRSLLRKWLFWPLLPGKDAAFGVVVFVPGSVRPPGGASGGPKPGGAAGAEPAVRGAARAEPGVDGNHFQHPTGDCHPYGILCLQAHSASVTPSKLCHEFLETE